MGASQSTLNDPNDQSASSKLARRHAFQILKVHPNSPVSETRIFPYFDYIIAVNSVEVSPDIPNLIGEMARNHVNKPLKLTIYNSRQDEERQITIVPRTGWGGDGLLGCAIRSSPLEGVRDRVWHILNVYPNSPAQKAGLIAEEDFVIASPDILIRNEDEFYQLITQNTARNVKLIVFNAKTEELREIVIVPDFAWGGEGCLGCDVGSGMVHWVPSQAKAQMFTTQLPPSSPQMNQSSPQLPTQPEMPSSLQNNNQPIEQVMPIEPMTAFPSVPTIVPTSRPLIDNLSSLPITPQDASSTPPSHPPLLPSPTKAPPLPQSATSTSNTSRTSSPAPLPVDDIPLPNFSVPSDIVNQQ